MGPAERSRYRRRGARGVRLAVGRAQAGDRLRPGADRRLRPPPAGDADRLRGRDAARASASASARSRSPRSAPTARPAGSDARHAVHDRARRQGRGRRRRRRLLAAPRRRRHPPADAALDRHLRRRSHLRARRRAGAGLDGVRDRGARAGRHDRRARQRVRHRSQAPAVRPGRDRPARRSVGGDGARRRDAPTPNWSPPTCSPRPSTARPPPRCWSAPTRHSPREVCRWVERRLDALRPGRRRRDRRARPGATTAPQSSSARPEHAVRAVDGLAPEHLEVQTDRRRLVLRAAAQLRLDLHRRRGRPSRSPTRRSAPTTRCRPDRPRATPAGCRWPSS